MCINVFVFPCEIQKINKWGGGVKISCGGGGFSKNYEKIKRLPQLILNLRVGFGSGSFFPGVAIR